MFSRRGVVLGGAALLTTSISANTAQSADQSVSSRNRREQYVTQITVLKKKRRLYLISGRRIVRKYKISLGFAPEGDKKVQGDGKTPEGRYYIDRRNPESSFHLSLGISYPNGRDHQEAELLGRDPGGDIFIHGEASRRKSGKDWTAGCIAVKNEDMEEIYKHVRVGTIIDILP